MPSKGKAPCQTSDNRTIGSLHTLLWISAVVICIKLFAKPFKTTGSYANILSSSYRVVATESDSVILIGKLQTTTWSARLATHERVIATWSALRCRARLLRSAASEPIQTRLPQIDKLWSHWANKRCGHIRRKLRTVKRSEIINC